MAIFSISTSAVELLIQNPESGMGYQVIRYEGEFVVIFNATIGITLPHLLSNELSATDLELFAGNPDNVAEAPIEQLQLFDRVDLAYSDFQRQFRFSGVPIRSSDIVGRPPPGMLASNRPYPFFRFCSYWRDKRVDPITGDFLPGTYATTYNDLPFVPSGYAAVGRYALPYRTSARWIFPLVTYDKPTLMGTATPNFGQAGGGVEVFFENRAHNAPGNSFMIDAG